MRLLLFNLATDVDDPFLAFTVYWIKALAKRVEKIDVITMRVGRIEVPDNVRVYSVGKERGYSEPHRAFKFYRILSHLLTRNCYDVCFAHMMPLFALMAAPLLRIKNIPVVLWYTHKSVTLMLRMATFLVDRVVTASKESFRIESSKVRIIGHGIDTDRFIPENNERSSHHPFTVLTVGRLSRIKRIELLIEAVALFRRKEPELPICLKIVGEPLTDRDQNYIAELKRQVDQYQLQNTIVFAGSVPFQEVTSCYQQADCFVNLCPTGGVDKAVLEAMSCGVVTVVANRTFTEVFGKELAETLLFDLDEKQLCDRLLFLISMSESERRQLGKQLRDIVVRNHDLSKLCKQLIQEFREVCHRISD